MFREVEVDVELLEWDLLNGVWKSTTLEGMVVHNHVALSPHHCEVVVPKLSPINCQRSLNGVGDQWGWRMELRIFLKRCCTSVAHFFKCPLYVIDPGKAWTILHKTFNMRPKTHPDLKCATHSGRV